MPCKDQLPITALAQSKEPGPDATPPPPVPSAIAHRRPLAVEFPPGVESVEIPSQFDGMHVIVRLTVNGRGLDLALDTGAPSITLDQQVANELGLTAFGQRSVLAAQRYTTAN